MSLGFERAGFKLLAAFDNWIPAIDVYRKNFEHPVFERDLSDHKAVGKDVAAYKPEIVIGGPPCQDFSSAGKRDESLGRANLTVAFSRIIEMVSPGWFVMENVPRAQGSAAYKKARAKFKSAGYGLTEIILNASLCGVPQDRKRFFVIGRLGGIDAELHDALTENLADKPMTLRDYFGDRLGIDHYYRHPRSYKRRAVFSVDEPSPTIRGVNRPIPKGYPGHAGDTESISKVKRPLTTAERSQIQTFPESFELLGTKAEIEQLIGNAVPVGLSHFVATAIINYLDGTVISEAKPSKLIQKKLF